MIFKFLANNLAAMLAISLLYGGLIRWKHKSVLLKKVLYGVFFSIAALIVMANTYTFETGVIFDSRSVLLSIAGLFCGPVTAAIAAVSASVYRISQGGAGTVMGVLVIIVSSLIGVVFYYLRKTRPFLTKPLWLYIFGLVVHAAMIVLISTLPRDIAVKVIGSIALPVIVLFPFGTVLLGMMLVDQERRVDSSEKIENYNRRLVEANERLTREIAERERAQTELRESEEHFKRAVTESPLPLMIHAQDGEVIHISKAWQKMTGYGPEELSTVDKWMENAHGAQARSIKNKLDALYKKDGRMEGEYQIKAANGEMLVWEVFSVSLGKLHDGRAIVMSVAVDVTSRKRAEEQLREAKDKTDDINRYLEIQTMYANEMAKKAEAANIAKTQFLANMSHEIRTPMNAIIGFSSFLSSENLTETQKQDVDIIIESSNILLNLINDILDFSKIEAGEIDAELLECSTDKLLYSLEALMRPKTTEKNLEFKVIKSPGVPPIIYTDPTRLNQCLINLVGNAIKFTDQGHVYIKVAGYKADGENFIKFDIEDTGIGIDQAKQDIIFEPFRQVDGSMTRRYGGTGLGLAITKELAELLGGSLSMQSTPGQGSVFTISIPVGDYLSEKMPQRHSDENRSVEVTVDAKDSSEFEGDVLVAEDARTNQVFIKRLLEKFGLNVTIVEDGAAAVREAMNKEYRIIFMDIQMPRMNGYQATGMLREKNVKTPIIALTANAMVGDEEKCLKVGCDAYLAKPVRFQDMQKLLSKFLTHEGRETT